jgi:DNA-binding MarR family transcriptional regulator
MHFNPKLQNRWAIHERSPSEHKEVGRKLRSLMAMTARRSRHFPDELFTDPAWDMLVALALAGEEHRKLSISQLSAATSVPATTAHRWISSLTELGLVVQSRHPVDRSEVDTRLSQSASASMQDILSAAPF